MSRYEPLTRFLEARLEGQIPLTFGEIERILHRSLPPSARQHQPWWANTSTHSHAGAWMRAGWRTGDVNLASERVTFYRTNVSARPRATAESPRTYSVEAQNLTPVAAKMLEDYAAEASGDIAVAMARALHEAAVARRRALIEQVRASAPKVSDRSVDLIREDRDAR